MKKDGHVMQKILLFMIGVLSIILTAVIILKVHEFHQDKLQREEWEVRHVEVQAEVDDARMRIQELAGDREALEAFLNENVKAVEEENEEETAGQTEISEQPEKVQTDGEMTDGSQGTAENPVPGEESEETAENLSSADGSWQGVNQNGDAILIDIPEKALPQQPEGQAESVSNNSVGQAVQEESVSSSQTGMETEEETVSGNGLFSGEETVSGNDTLAETEETVSGNGTVSGNYVPRNEYETISGNAVVDGKVIPFRYEDAEMTLEARRNIRSSYAETEQMNGEDRFIISNSAYDFSDMTIACLGDSITEGSNLDYLDNYEQYSYPSVLKNILHAKEVYNLGIGGSSYGRYWDKAFVDRYQEIPADTDIILVMGGTNDGFAASEKELGSLAEKKPKTYYGDVDELMRGLKKNYPEAKIIFVTPLPNVLHDYLRNQRDYLLPQNLFAKAVKELAAQYDIDVIDLYNSNLLDTHDAQVISAYMPDGVHGNPAGYQILAEHIASRVIRIMEEDSIPVSTVSGNEPEKEGIVVDAGGSVSGNGTGGEVQSEDVSGNAAGTPHMQDGKWIEEEIMSEEERAEEAQRAEENSRKAAQEGMLVEPVPQETPVSAAGETAAGQQTDSEDVEEEEPVREYEYGGEAIVIQ